MSSYIFLSSSPYFHVYLTLAEPLALASGVLDTTCSVVSRTRPFYKSSGYHKPCGIQHFRAHSVLVTNRFFARASSGYHGPCGLQHCGAHPVLVTNRFLQGRALDTTGALVCRTRDKPARLTVRSYSSGCAPSRSDLN